MKARRIQSKIWKDTWFCELSRPSKLLFLYFISSEYVGLSGFAEISDRTIMFDTGIKSNELEEAKKEISPKVKFFKNWVFITNLLKYDPIEGEKNNLWKAYQKELSLVPEEIKKELEAPSKPLPTPLGGSKGIGIGKVKVKEESVRGEAEKLIALFNDKFDRGYTLTASRKEMIGHRLRVFELHQLEKAVINLSNDPFSKGKNDRKWVATPDYLFRSDEVVDRALNLDAKNHPERKVVYEKDLI